MPFQMQLLDICDSCFIFYSWCEQRLQNTEKNWLTVKPPPGGWQVRPYHLARSTHRSRW